MWVRLILRLTNDFSIIDQRRPYSPRLQFSNSIYKLSYSRILIHKEIDWEKRVRQLFILSVSQWGAPPPSGPSRCWAWPWCRPSSPPACWCWWPSLTPRHPSRHSHSQRALMTRSFGFHSYEHSSFKALNSRRNFKVFLILHNLSFRFSR